LGVLAPHSLQVKTDFVVTLGINRINSIIDPARMLLKPRPFVQMDLLGLRGAGSIIKTLKIACYCRGKASYVQGRILFHWGIGTSNGLMPPQ